MRLSRKISIGFANVLFCTVIVGLAGYYALTSNNSTYLLSKINLSQSYFASAKEHTDQYFLNNYAEAGDIRNSAKSEAIVFLEKCRKSVNEIRIRKISLKITEQLDRVGNVLDGYEKSFADYVKSEDIKQELAASIISTHPVLNELIAEGSLWVEEIQTKTEVLFGIMPLYFDRNADIRLNRTETAMAELKKAIENWNEKVRYSDTLRPVGEKIRSQFETIQAAFSQYQTEVSNQKNNAQAMLEHKKELNRIFTELPSMIDSHLREVQGFSVRLIIIFIIAALVIGILYSIFSTRSIVTAINHAVHTIHLRSRQVSNASDELSRSNNQLAEDAATQATSINEMTQLLDTIENRTKLNTENTLKANELMAQIFTISDQTRNSMHELLKSVQDVSDIADQTQNIISIINNIAFQTNLLALNASVEAARAGDAGSGFAVVASEVRTLASRTSEAAKNTSELIEKTLGRSRHSFEIASKNNEVFTDIADFISNIRTLIDEIAASSGEQADSIRQLHHAAKEIEKITFQNSASAEQCASASEKMNSQASDMTQVVMGLAKEIQGTSF